MMAALLRWTVLAKAAIALAAGPAVACTICLTAVGVSPGERLDNADRVVIAVPGSTGAWRTVADIKGTGRVEPAALIEARPAGDDDGAVLFLREGLGQRWTGLGNVDIGAADWLRRLVETPAPRGHDAETAATAWLPRLDLAWRQPGSTGPLVEAIAEGELARAPYPALLSLGRTLTSREVLERLGRNDEPVPRCTSRLCQTMAHLSVEGRSPQRAPYIHLLGAIADGPARTFIDDAIDAALASGDATDLAALLAADLEIRGPSRIGWIEARYFRDDSRSLDEIEAALGALRVHAAAGTSVPREDVVAAYATFIEARPQMAGFVAADLSAWADWSATEAFVSLLNADAIGDPAGRFAALSYVQQSADTRASARLDLENE